MMQCPVCFAPEGKPHVKNCAGNGHNGNRNGNGHVADPMYPNARPQAFEMGLEFQDYVCLLLAKHYIVLQNFGSKLYQIQHGENLQGFEIKYDERCTDTKRLSIEIAEKSRADDTRPWVASGIMRTDNTWLYIQGNYQIIFVFAKNWLVKHYNAAAPEVSEKFGTVRTFYLPFDIAEAGAARVLRPTPALETTRRSA